MSERMTLPVLPLRDFVLFPGVTTPINAGRPSTLRAIEAALATPGRLVFAVSQREDVKEVTPEHLYTIGTVARIGQVQRGLAGMQLLLHGENRGISMRVIEKDGHLEATVREAEEMAPLNTQHPSFIALFREARERAAELGKKAGLPDEVVQNVLAGVEEPGRLADLVAAYTELTQAQRQSLLEALSVEERLRRVLVHVQRQLSVIEAQEDIKSKVQEELGDRQREMLLREQMRAIQKELGEGDDPSATDGLREKLASLALPEEVRKEVDRELGRLSRMGREGMESQVIRTYLETISELPWSERSPEHLELSQASDILEADHYALGDVKDRVLEFLAVRQLRQKVARAEKAREAAEEGEASGDDAIGGLHVSNAADAADAADAGDCRRYRAGRVRQGGARQRGREDQGSDPPLRRPSGSRQDLGRQVDRPRHGAQVRPHLAGRRARRGGHPRSPADLRRRHAGPHSAGDEAGGDQEPGLPARRGRQARRLLPGRSGERPPGGPRPGAERHLHRPLPGGAVRPLGGALHRHRELHPEHPGAAPRSDGGGAVRRLHRAREARHRPPVPGAAPADGERGHRRPGGDRRRRGLRGHHRLHPRGRRPPARTGDGPPRPQGGAQDRFRRVRADGARP